MASFAGKPGLALGNGVGSIICNMAMIFGLCCCIRRLAEGPLHPPAARLASVRRRRPADGDGLRAGGAARRIPRRDDPAMGRLRVLRPAGRVHGPVRPLGPAAPRRGRTGGPAAHAGPAPADDWPPRSPATCSCAGPRAGRHHLLRRRPRRLGLRDLPPLRTSRRTCWPSRWSRSARACPNSSPA